MSYLIIVVAFLAGFVIGHLRSWQAVKRCKRYQDNAIAAQRDAIRQWDKALAMQKQLLHGKA